MFNDYNDHDDDREPRWVDPSARPASGPRPTQGMSEDAINQINLHMRQQPWYQEWFQMRGLDPNRVRLSDRDRNSLTHIAAQNGMPLGDRMKFDEAGNVNQKGGWAGMPTWAKVAIGAGAAAATGGVLGAAGAFGGAAGGGASGAGAAAGSIPTIGSTAIGTGLGFGPASLAGTSALAGGAGAASAALPVLASKAIGTGMGYGPSSLAGTSALGGGAAAIPEIASRVIGNGMGTDPAKLPNTTAGALDGWSWDAGLGKWVQKAAEQVGNKAADSGVDWLMKLLPALAGVIPGLVGNRQTAEEKSLLDQQRRLLAMQESRLRQEDPLFQAVQRMAVDLMPKHAKTGPRIGPPLPEFPGYTPSEDR